ncbi:cuticle protein 10.9-like [Stegodyphus dumicola]|uniref:cuticle protein 10.9-like n=1 Tax=Stegodyphus dumicola TaxID=202533 RepID=UPI0015B3120F|nr:cuticle protein 10.9-like [Stegodyphus dumicola]
MFKLVVAAALFAAVCAVPYGRPYAAPVYARSYAAPAYSAPAPHYGGYAPVDYAVPTPYEFGYDIAGDYGEFKQNRKEASDGKGNVQGSYGYTDAHGIYRQVDYVADAHGFRANVKTNEPGTDNQNPADVYVQASPAQYAPAPHYGGYPKY